MEEKNKLLNEIKGYLLNCKFESALDLCVLFVEKFPNCFNGWAYYILAYCKVSTVQELVNSNYMIQELSIYEEAIKTLDETERQKLIAWKEKIELVKKRNGVKDDSCVTYFYRCLRKLKAEIISLKEQQSQCIERDKDELKKIKKGNSSFFANSLIYFCAYCSLVVLPLIFIYVFLIQLNASLLFKILPLIAAIITVILIVVKKRKKWKIYSSEFVSHKESCDFNVTEIVALQTEIDEKTAGFKKLKGLYVKVKRKGVLSEEFEMNCRKKFDGIYNKLVVNKKEQ